MKSEKQRLHLEKLRQMKIGVLSPLLGRKREPFSKDHKKNISLARKGKYNGLRVEKVQNSCLHCNNIFLAYSKEIQRGRKKFCSRKCYTIFQSINFRGENHRNWQGGLTLKNSVGRGTLEYRNWRMSVFKRDNFTCVLCGDNKGGNLNADHIKPFAHFPELRYNMDNGRTLCVDCHRKTDTYAGKGFKREYYNKKIYV